MKDIDWSISYRAGSVIGHTLVLFGEVCLVVAALFVVPVRIAVYVAERSKQKADEATQ